MNQGSRLALPILVPAASTAFLTFFVDTSHPLGSSNGGKNSGGGGGLLLPGWDGWGLPRAWALLPQGDSGQDEERGTGHVRPAHSGGRSRRAWPQGELSLPSIFRGLEEARPS